MSPDTNQGSIIMEEGQNIYWENTSSICNNRNMSSIGILFKNFLKKKTKCWLSNQQSIL